MLYHKTTIRAQSAPWNDAIEFLIITQDASGNKAFGANIRMETKLDHEGVLPTFSLSRDAAQLLMDELWNCHIRPTEGTGSAGSLKATQDHLEDMRKISFDLLKRLTP